MRASAIALLAVACSSLGAPKWETDLDSWVHPDPIPAVPLTNAAGVGFSLDDYDESWVVMSFLFSHCPVEEMCPATLRRLDQLARQFNPTEGTDLQILVVTLDPLRDTPERLTEWGQEVGLHERVHLTSGKAELVSRDLPALFNVIGLPSDGDNLTHNLKVALLSPGRVPVAEWKDDAWTPEQVLAKITVAAPQ